MPHRRFTLGRAVALLIFGVGLGVAIFISDRLRPDTLRLQVAVALKELVKTNHGFKDVKFRLDTGIEVENLWIEYPPEAGKPALRAAEVERLVLMVDHRDLLSGEVTIRRVELHGLVLRLKAGEGTPTIPGVFAGGVQADTLELPDELPEIRIYDKSRVEILDATPLVPGTTLALEVKGAEAHAEGNVYRVAGEFTGTRVSNVNLTLRYDKLAQRVTVDVNAGGVSWSRDDVNVLTKEVRRHLPPVQCGGEADIEAHAELRLPLQLEALTVDADLRKVHGVFGNVHTFEAVGLPFGVQEGKGNLHYDFARQLLQLHDFDATYVSTSGAHGRIQASADFVFRELGLHLDLWLHGHDLQGSTEDLRHLLPPDIVESIVEKFLPAGTFDFDLTVSQRPSTEEKVVAWLEMHDGQFNYAGQLDKLTGQRFGFRYPVERCSGRFRMETHVPTSRGLADVIEIEELKGFNQIARPQVGGALDVAVEAQGRAVTYAGPPGEEPEDLDFTIDVRDLPIDAKLARAFASTPGGMPYKGFDVSGSASRVLIRIKREGFREPEARASYDVTLEDCRVAYEGFPFPIEKVGGRIISEDQAGDHGRVLRIEGLHGEAPAGGQINARGTVRQDDAGTQLLDLSVTAEKIAIGADLERALVGSRAAATGITDLWRSVRPYGFLSATATFSGPQSCNIEIDLSQLSLRGYQEFECPITELRGSVSYDLKTLRIDDLSGLVFEAPFTVSGQFLENGSFQVTGSIDGIVLQDAVRHILEAVAPPAARAIEQLRIDPTSAFDLRLDCWRTSENDPVELDFSVDDLNVKSRIMDLDLLLQGGPIKVSLDKITAENLHIRAGDGEIHVRQVVVPNDDRQETWALIDANNLDPAQHLEHLFGPGIRESLGRNARLDLAGFRVEFQRPEQKLILSGALDLRRNVATEGVALEPIGQVDFNPITLTLPPVQGGPLRFAGVIEFRHLNCNMPISIRDLGGELRVVEGTLSPEFSVTGALHNTRATLFDRELTAMSINLTYRPDYLHLGNVDGRAYDGEFEGDVEVYLEEPRAFKARFQARNVLLGDMLKEDLPRSEPMTGTVEARLEFESPSGEVRDMHGRGQIRVKEGSLFKVPGLRPILAVLSRVTPIEDEPRFTRAEADFTVAGEEITLHHCRLSTALNDVDADGTISIYGDLNLVVEPKVTRLIDLLEGTLNSPTIRLRGLPFLRPKTVRRFTQSPHAGRAERVRPHLLP